MPDLAGALATLPQPDEGARTTVAARAAQVLRPAGAFDRLDQVAAALAGWQRTAAPHIDRAVAILFAADHGVARESVSAYPAAITTHMAEAIRSGVATSTAIARAVGAEVQLVDVGIGRPTGNIRHEDALSPRRYREAVEAGTAAVSASGADLLIFGEMGIGNTTAAAAVAMAILGGDAASWVGPGSGVSGAALANKREVVRDAVSRVGDAPPLEQLRRLGGSELVAIAAAIVRARQLSIPVLLDGFIATAAALPLEAEQPGALDHCIAGHRSGEPGHASLLAHLDKAPLLDLGLSLGEGTGALAALPLLRIALVAVSDVATFEERGLA